jgi:outer membrane protein TolC
LQLEIQELNTLREAAAAQLRIDKARLYLQLVVNSPDISRLEIQLPDNLPILNLDKQQLLTDAKKQLPLYINFQKEILEAKSNTARVKAQNNQVNLTASYGLTNTANNIPAIYQNPNDQQRFSIGFAIPLITWGKNKNSIAAARLQEKQAELINKAEEARWLSEITSLINELPALQRNVTAARRIDTLTQKKYSITNRLFQSGKASLLELQAAQSEKDIARRNYIQALRQFWESWYLLKVKTNSE